MATVRIYKVAELLNATSQDVITLLKKEHGIEVKSASSTIEEVVAREFVARQARLRGVKVPSNASFADTPNRPSPRRPRCRRRASSRRQSRRRRFPNLRRRSPNRRLPRPRTPSTRPRSPLPNPHRRRPPS
ncbi:MAG: hypothetical protein DMF86_23040 [Acidobacteria bacterium]|nr:MAG: hypothetical protein DMF86_23040 [Acidobacteriota bacterium]